ncbi:hypothetical protein SY2F82_02160 [Streptomyces sp. Y2F8-2]|uniref:golvesin C-terminal-like domain-containing protein n=1 Tax=Streptomyces sp. Y2F8-2 TaxID=2759675 RepID=UPI001A4E07E5|nr:DNA/RNA non-specific endonuclease [Streptomyces sp. Y2F8-2]GHJ98418.1 hypothetical protein SY2F82_02160 [Streptomyces sp. Y2F8-2]
MKFPQVSGAATAAKYTLTHDGGTTDKTIDQTTGAGTWVSLGSYSFKQGNAAKLQLFQNSTGTVVSDGVKLVRDNSADTDNEQKTFTYTYDANGNLTSIDDNSSGAQIDAYTIAYTGLNQVQQVTESLAGQEKKSTSYTYDANSLLDTITHPDQFSKYTYDLRDLVKTVSVGKTPTDASSKLTSYTYTGRDQTLRETKANGNTVDYTYYLDGPVKSTREKKPNGTLVSSHTYAYDPNGNKTQDVAKKMNADSHSVYLNSTTDYTYDPANRLKQSMKTGNGATTETYVHDDNSNVISQTVGGVTTDYNYDRNRLLTATTSGSTASYNYDPFGRQESVTSGGQVVERSVYDGFDHVVESQKADATGAMKSTTYTFDPLDRTASETADGKTTDYEYLGLSSEVLDEKVAGTLTKSYQYSPWGERLSQVKHNSDGTTEDGYYGYNGHTDVETLTDDNGDTKATYGYTAYGKDDASEFTGIDKPDAADPTKEAYNPYRYNAKRWDAQSGTYDMGFRNYNPGLNRFTTRDMYNGALSDMGLGADPFTGNRYAFGSGNPISNVEIDGHFDVGGFIDSAVDTIEGAVEGAAEGIAEGAETVAGGGSSLLSKAGGYGLAAWVFLEELGWDTPTAQNGYESDPGDKPDYSKGLLLKPDSVKEWQPGDARVPFTKEDCQKSRSSMIYYMPLDSQGRAQGAIACLNKSDINYTDKEGNLKDPNNSTKMVGSTTIWPMSTPGAWAASPKGWRPGMGLDRAHLVARQFGGSGTDRRNLVPLPSDVNQDSMGDWEKAISDQLELGNTVYYEISASYQGDSTVPSLQGLAASSGGAVYPWGYVAGQ